MSTDNKPTREQLDEWHTDPNNWKLGFFYFNPKDKRIFPPKRVAGLGWTVNFGNPASVLAMAALLGMVFYITSLIRH
jgi:uncharacterized membrane protein